jgi:photosystem II stability/assembly factor-like uncharacterized protein/DNA-binding FrmR family transcriptional regulator
LILFSSAPAADEKPAATPEAPLFSAMKYRLVGPFRGGRSCAVTGVPGKPLLFYFGSTGGGVWRTTDGGTTWQNISDGFFGGSIGAVAVSESDPSVIYVGGGEKTVRGNVSHGDGMWKSTDAGKTWKHVGLADSRHIPRVRIHPKDPNIAYAAVLGHLFGPNKERGVYRTTDGGSTWKQVLFVNDEVGAIDLALDPGSPSVMYASTWRVKRTPYSLESGGPGSGLWKSTDGGEHWTEITKNKGLPQATVGIIGVSVSPVDSDRVWALVEADDGGVFRSDDAGKTWTKTSEDRNLRQRAWYYTRIYAHPKNKDEVWIVNVGLMRSTDGGKTFTSIRTPHGDHHDLWFDPTEPMRMIVGDDGGAQVTMNAGAGWSTYHNQPTAQFYRVTTDNHFPYRLLGAQQDNSTVRILSRSDDFAIDERDWESSAGSESGWLAADPKDPDIVYGGNYGGYIGRINHKTKESRNVTVWPDNPLGHGAEDMKYRFQWNFPLFFSPHDAKTLYAGGNVLFKTTNEGQTWSPISPDLTRNDKSKQGPSGGPITKDNTGVEVYCTVFCGVESPLEAGVTWCGSDDGLVHVTRDGGKNWQKVTPPEMPDWCQINSIEAHPTEKGGAYVAATSYKRDDFHPYLFKTADYGKTWTKIVTGIKDDHFTRVVRADPKRPGLLYCGTECGMYISFDDGGHWQKFQLNLPLVPITDLVVKNDDLVVATQGRSFWVLDDLTPLHQLKTEFAEKPLFAYTPRPTYRLPGGGFGGGDDDDSPPPRTAGQNPPAGVVLYCWLKDAPAKEPKDKESKEAKENPASKISLEILDSQGAVVREFSPKADRPSDKWEPKNGLNRFVWDLRYTAAESFPGMVVWGGMPSPRAMPGRYQARFKVGPLEQTVAFEVKPDPRSSTTPADLEAQFKFLISARDKLTEAHRAIKQIRDVRDQLTGLQKRLKEKADFSDVVEEIKSLEKQMTAIEEALYQTKAKSSQDVLNFPIRLNNKLISLAGAVSDGDKRPTDQSVQVKDELIATIDGELSKLHTLIDSDLARFNAMLAQKKVPGVFSEPVSEKKK